MYNIYEQMSLIEAHNSDYTTHEEEIIHKKLIKLLREDHHNKYADRLELYYLHIVENDPAIGGDPEFTAAISTTKPIIYLSRGFLQDDAIFNQLSMLMRHELAHNLMKHEYRMMMKMSKSKYQNMAKSRSFHELLNVIMDDEISNRRYSEEDKRLCRNLKLGGKVIMGLVTEDHRDDWKKMSLTEMYDMVTKELEQIRQSLVKKMAPGPKVLSVNGKEIIDPVEHSIYSIFKYVDDTKPATMFGSCKGDEILKSKYFLSLKKYPEYKPITDYIESFVKICVGMSEKKLNAILKKVCNSELFDDFTAGSVEIRTPEEKLIIVEIIKYFLGNVESKPTIDVKRAYHYKEYLDWYNKTAKDNYKDKSLSIDDIKKALNKLAGMGILANETEYGNLSEDDYIKRYGGIK